jgi:cation:H+ antiporter
MALTPLLFLAAGLALLLVGAEGLVRGASGIAGRFGIPPLVIGLTVVAFGTSAPELAVSLRSTLDGQAGLAVGNVVGSNIFNVLLILGISALVTPLAVSRQLVRIDVPLMIGASALVWILAMDGHLGRAEGLLLFGGLLGYLVLQFRIGAREGALDREKPGREVREVRAVRAVPERPRPRVPVPGAAKAGPSILLQVALTVGGLALLVVGARWLVAGAVEVAEALGVSDLVIGLTIVAGGTSLPEVATSVLASLRGERDIAVGNVVGSNLFNLLGVLGLTATLAPGGLPVPLSTSGFDLPFMTAAALVCLPIFVTGLAISRWEGAVFLGYYVAYTAYLVLRATEHDALPLFSGVMLAFVVPLTVLALGGSLVRELSARRGRRKRSSGGAGGGTAGSAP